MEAREYKTRQIQFVDFSLLDLLCISSLLSQKAHQSRYKRQWGQTLMCYFLCRLQSTRHHAIAGEPSPPPSPEKQPFLCNFARLEMTFAPMENVSCQSGDYCKATGQLR
ncbi:hypothetical protein FF1_044287 [Malus domestica]